MIARLRPKERDIVHLRDEKLELILASAQVRFRRRSDEEHRDREAAWREIYGVAFRSGCRLRQGAKAIQEFLDQNAKHWLMIPFLSGVSGTAVTSTSRQQTPSAYECEGQGLELGDFRNCEFFIAPPSLDWTFVRTHEDFALGGPYFIRAEWVQEVEHLKQSRGRRR